jgi:hypothetical protein
MKLASALRTKAKQHNARIMPRNSVLHSPQPSSLRPSPSLLAP